MVRPARPSARRAVHGVSERAEQAAEGAVEYSEEQGLLGAEHPHHVGLADAGGLGHGIRRRAHVATLAEDDGGRLQDEFPARGRLHARRRFGAVRGHA